MHGSCRSGGAAWRGINRSAWILGLLVTNECAQSGERLKSVSNESTETIPMVYHGVDEGELKVTSSRMDFQAPA